MTCDPLKELCSNPQSPGTTQSLHPDSSVSLDGGAVLAQQHPDGGGGEGVQAEDGEVLVVQLLALHLPCQQGLGGLDAGQQPGLALVRPVGSDPQTDLGGAGVRLVVSGELEHLYGSSGCHTVKPAGTRAWSLAVKISI